jgi:hypothetical protein
VAKHVILSSEFGYSCVSLVYSLVLRYIVTDL